MSKWIFQKIGNLSVVILLTFFVGRTVFGFSGGGGPFPFGETFPLPWENIQGLWYGYSEAYKVLFSFEIIDTARPDGSRQVCDRQKNYEGCYLLVKQLDPLDLHEISVGRAIEHENVVSGLMKTTSNGFVYNLTFRLAQIKGASPGDVKYVVLTMESLLGDTSSNFYYYFSMAKKSQFPIKSCEQSAQAKLAKLQKKVN